MARILVSLRSPDSAANVSRILENEGYDVVSSPWLNGEDTTASVLAQVVIENEADLTIWTYISRDALTVKAMQEALSHLPHGKFIFIDDEETSRDHVIMALNEGAASFMSEPLVKEALLNYVGRAINAQQDEKNHGAELERVEQLVEIEKANCHRQVTELSKHKRILQQCYRLISEMLPKIPARDNSKVLLVSDSGYQIDLFRRTLEEHGFQVISASDGRQGLEKAREERPLIIISDLEMPELSGVELCRAIKNDKTFAPNYFIVCTASRDRIEDVLAPENKVDDCLRKPSRPEEFLEFTARVALGLLG